MLFSVLTIDTPSLGDRSYLVHDGTVAFVVDPQRDIDRILALLLEHGVRLTDVFETHIHNDYVTGGLALAAATGAAYHVNAADPVAFDRQPISEDQTVAVGPRMRMTAIATPGHTHSHLSYALTDASPGTQAAAGGRAALDRAQAVFSGGSLLYGVTGRPDLLGPEHTHDLARHQHESAHKLAALLPDAARVLPTHGFGSFCSSTPAPGITAESTMGYERTTNPVLNLDAEDWIEALLAGLDVWPAYYAQMAPANLSGPSAPDLNLPALADAGELRRRIEVGEWVVDLRHRTAFARGHAPGSLNFGIDGPFATYLGWLIDWGTPITLLGDTPEDVSLATRELGRIGIDHPVAHATGGPQDWSDRPLAGFATATFPELAQVRHHREVVLIDVRRVKEYDAARIPGALNLPLHDLPRRLHEVPSGEVWVHCGGGYRASVAASFLIAAGREVVAIDDDFANAALAGLLDRNVAVG